MSKNDGGPAFPWGDPPRGGMSLRDYFAAAALTGNLASVTPESAANIRQLAKDNNMKLVELEARVAYAYADAMLAEREKVNE